MCSAAYISLFVAQHTDGSPYDLSIRQHSLKERRGGFAATFLINNILKLHCLSGMEMAR
jgi:hypothetical protein